jgi:hypothetical protein
MTKKLNAIYEAPVLNRSGYGNWSDHIFYCLNSYLPFDLKVAPQGWGNCVQRQCETSKDKEILEKIIRQPLTVPLDVHISHTLPHLTNPQGRFNINISAGIEVSFVRDNIIDGLNKQNLNIVCSEFAKKVYLESPKKCTKPIEVLHWAADTTIYKITSETVPSIEEELSKVKEQESFLFVGQYTSSQIFNDRKDIGNLIKTFLETFKDKLIKPALILKTNGVNFSYADRNILLDKLESIKGMVKGELPNVYILHGELSEVEMNALLNHKKIIAHISFSHGEGFGHPLLLASLSAKPVFASNYSAHTEFLTNSPLLEGSLVEIQREVVSEFFPEKSKWFVVDYKKAGEKIANYFYGDRTKLNADALELAKTNAEKFNLSKMQYRLHKLLNRYL